MLQEAGWLYAIYAMKQQKNKEDGLDLMDTFLIDFLKNLFRLYLKLGMGNSSITSISGPLKNKSSKKIMAKLAKNKKKMNAPITIAMRSNIACILSFSS